MINELPFGASQSGKRQKRGALSISQNFRNFWFGGKWNTFRPLVPLENSQKKWKI